MTTAHIIPIGVALSVVNLLTPRSLAFACGLGDLLMLAWILLLLRLPLHMKFGKSKLLGAAGTFNQGTH